MEPEWTVIHSTNPLLVPPACGNRICVLFLMLPTPSADRPFMEHSALPAPAWKPLDEAVAVAFDSSGSEPRPASLHWRGSAWRVVGTGRHWSTWHALPVRSSASEAPAIRGVRIDFWRFRARSGPFSPLLHFEIRSADPDWRLVRLAGTSAPPLQDPLRPARCCGRHRCLDPRVSADGITLAP